MVNVSRLVLSAAVVALLSGCAAPDPAAQRRAYDVSLNGWAAKEDAPPAPIVDETVSDAAAEAETPASPEEGAIDVPPAPATVQADVQLSILVTNNGGDLEQLTVEISHADAAGVEKGTYRRTLDIAQIVRGLTSDVTVVLEDVEIGARGETGAYPDQFAVSLRQEIPATERAEYPELAGGG
jgi:hypothetical protein